MVVQAMLLIAVVTLLIKRLQNKKSCVIIILAIVNMLKYSHIILTYSGNYHLKKFKGEIMKNEEILKVLTDNGIEVAEDKQKDLLSALNKLSGIDVTNAKKDYETLNNELLKYQKGGELYVDKEEYENLKNSKVDSTELEELRKYKAETENKIAEETRTKSINELLTGTFDNSVINLLSIAAKQKAEFDSDNSIKNKDDLLKGLKEEYGKFIVTETNDGAKPKTEFQDSPEKQPESLEDAFKDYYKK